MSPPLHVMHVVADGEPGGGTTVVLGLAAGLIAHGVRATLVSAPGSYALDAAAARGVDAAPCMMFGPGAVLAPRRLAHLAAEAGATIVHLHGSRAGLIGVAALRPRRRRVGVVYTVHGVHSLARREPWRTVGGLAQRITHRAADEVVWVSETDAAIARDAGWLPAERGRVIPNGIDLDSLPPSSPPSAREVSFLGRLTHPKKPAFMVELARVLRDDGYTVRMIGGGDEESAIRERVRRDGLGDVVRLTGALPHAAALEAVRTASVLVLPSHWEGYPTAPLEAMALSVPVVGSRVRGVSAVIDDGVNGLLFPPGDVTACADAVRRLDTDAELRRRLVAGGLATARSHARPAMLERYLEVYGSVS